MMKLKIAPQTWLARTQKLHVVATISNQLLFSPYQTFKTLKWYSGTIGSIMNYCIRKIYGIINTIELQSGGQ